MPSFAATAILIASVTAMPGNVLPVTLGLLATYHGLDSAEVGYLVATNTFAGLLTSITAPYWIRRVGLRRTVATCLILNALGVIALSEAGGLATLFPLQAVLGVTTVAIASICMSVLVRLDNPGRAIGFKITSDVVVAGSFLTLAPVGTLGLDGFVIALAIPLLLALALVSRLPTTVEPLRRPGVDPPSLLSAPASAWLVLMAMVTFYVAGAGLWPFIEHLALGAGLDRDQAANTIASGLFVGVFGSLGAAALAGRNAGIWPQTASGMLFVVAILLLAFARGPISYAIAVFAFNATWNFFIPFIIALLASHDRTARLSALVPGTAMLGGIIGPPLAGNLMTIASDEAACAVMALIAATAIAAYVALARGRGRP